MNREVSASFQAVEDWLRSLGLLHYAQSFYDNGYEDIETCKLMTEQDLNVIDIKNDQDRRDILTAINRLQQNLYFELEPEGPETTIERTKIDSILLKSKLKESLEREKIQLTEPPYYNKDGTVGDLYPLAIRYATELTTFFDDVLEALEQLRKRQLPTQNYDTMANKSPSQVRKDQENKDPAEYLNCEIPGCRHSSCFSKSDTRLTKSTTDLTKDINISGGSEDESPKGKTKKPKSFLAGVFKRGGTNRAVQSTLLSQDFKASELDLSQDEIVNIFDQVKNKEISQEEVLYAVKKRSLTKSTSYDLITKEAAVVGKAQTMKEPLTKSNSYDPITKEAAMHRKSKSLKDPFGKRQVSAKFYVQGDDTSHSSKSSLEKSGDHTESFVDEKSSLLANENSSEVNKQSADNIFNKIRNSTKGKKLNEGQLPPEEQDVFLKHDVHSFNETTGKEDCNLMDSMHTLHPQTTMILPPPPKTPPPPPPVEYMIVQTEMEDISPRGRKSMDPIDQELKRYSLEKNNNIPKNEIDINFENTSSNIKSPTKCNQLELTTELKKIIPKIPPRPAPRRPSENYTEPCHSKICTESTERQIDELVKRVNDIEVDLDNHLQHISSTDEDTKIIDSIKAKKPEPPLKASPLTWKKPVPPPRPSVSGVEDGFSVNSDSTSIGSRSSICKDTRSGKQKVSDIVTNKRWISKKLSRDAINLSQLPYTSRNGCWCIPYNLILRYVEELALPLQEIIKCFEEIRIDERKRMHQIFVPYTEKDLVFEKNNIHNTVDEYLVHIGLPMYVEDFREIGIKMISEINSLDECDLRRIGIFDRNHVAWLLKHAESI